MATVGFSQALVRPYVNAYDRTADALADSRYRLGSGTRIIRAGDDASSVSAATKLQAQSAGLRSTSKNNASATTYLQIATDSLAQLRETLTIMHAIATSAADGQRTENEISYLKAALSTNLARYDSIITSTLFNGHMIFDGSVQGNGAQLVITGTNPGDHIAITFEDLRSATLFPAGLNIVVPNKAAGSAIVIADAIQLIDIQVAQVEAYQLRLDTAAPTNDRTLYGLDLAIGSYLDTDVLNEQVIQNKNAFQQATAGIVIAQALSFNSNLLTLVSGNA